MKLIMNLVFSILAKNKKVKHVGFKSVTNDSRPDAWCPLNVAWPGNQGETLRGDQFSR